MWIILDLFARGLLLGGIVFGIYLIINEEQRNASGILPGRRSCIQYTYKKTLAIYEKI